MVSLIIAGSTRTYFLQKYLSGHKDNTYQVKCHTTNFSPLEIQQKGAETFSYLR